MPDPLRLFVYGTLKPGEANFDRYCRTAISAQPAWVQGQLYVLNLGYPGLVLGGSGLVAGLLLEFDESGVLAAIDELEDYRADRAADENEYQRQWCRVFCGDPGDWVTIGAWVYGMSADRVLALGGVELGEGWSGEIQERIAREMGWLGL
jgi:gamma-glutamylcyclotransferase (GGCT)/AIG2-like uncharacterized protein YtfP